MEAADKKRRHSVPLTVVEQNEAAPQDTENEIDLIELMYFMLEKIKLIIAVALLGAVIAFLYTFFLITPQYEATSQIYVLNASDSVVNLSDLQIGASLASDYLEVFNAWEIKQHVIENLQLDETYTYKKLGQIVKVSNPSNTRILKITATSPDPQMATDLANEYANVVRNFVSDTMATEKPNILSVALKPVAPVSPSKTTNTIIGFMLGLVAVCGVLVVQFVMDDKIKSTDDILRYAGLPTLAVVPLAGQEDKVRHMRYETNDKSEGSRKK